MDLDPDIKIPWTGSRHINSMNPDPDLKISKYENAMDPDIDINFLGSKYENQIDQDPDIKMPWIRIQIWKSLDSKQNMVVSGFHKKNYIFVMQPGSEYGSRKIYKPESGFMILSCGSAALPWVTDGWCQVSPSAAARATTSSWRKFYSPIPTSLVSLKQGGGEGWFFE